MTESNDFPVFEDPLDLQIVQKTDHKDNGHWQKYKTDAFKRNKFLKLHVVLVHLVAVDFLLRDSLVHFVYFVNQLIYQFTVFLFREWPQVWKLITNRVT